VHSGSDECGMCGCRGATCESWAMVRVRSIGRPARALDKSAKLAPHQAMRRRLRAEKENCAILRMAFCSGVQ
jgi:hypothetical protein